jgi:hypothetical protein
MSLIVRANAISSAKIIVFFFLLARCVQSKAAEVDRERKMHRSIRIRSTLMDGYFQMLPIPRNLTVATAMRAEAPGA